MKRVILVLVLVLAMLTVTACNQGGNPTTTTVTTSTEAASSSEASTSSIEGTSDSAGSSNAKVDLTIIEDLELTKLDGTIVKLSEVSKKHTIINLWAVWCGYCKKEMPELIELMKNREDVAVVFINQGEDKETIESFLKEKGYEIDVYLDENQKIGSMLQASGYPFNVFLTENRGLLTFVPGYLSGEQFEEILEKIEQFRTENNL